MKNYYRYMPYFGLIIVLAVLIVILFKPSLITSKYSFDQKSILKNIEQIGNLSVVKMNFQDVLDPTVSHSFFGLFDIPFVDSKALIVIRSEAEGCIDLTKVTKDDINIGETEITIKLPAPYVCHTKINLNDSKTYDVNLIAKVFNPELPDQARAQAEKNIADNATKLGILDLSQTNARNILAPIFQNLTNKNIKIEFDK
ncbi:MAG TPA: DUF4230 domain-containing protein [Candidatus Gracilibacteria bacterium]|nr:DUF4230 domain-containing protein [Candidatus Gracilibacteria bacterium]